MLTAAPACDATPQRVDDPLAVMLDRQAYPDIRQAAAAQAEADLFDAEERLAALERLIIEPGHGRVWQMNAIDQLAEADEQRAREFLRRHFASLHDPETLQHALDMAVDRDWADLLPAIVRRYAVTSPRESDEQRPERRAIEALAPGRPVRDTVRNVLADADGTDVRERAAAFVLLGRLLGDQAKLVATLEQFEAEADPLIADLQAAYQQFGIIPENMEAVAWLRVLRTRLHGPVWPEAAEAAAALQPEQRKGLALRHLPVLVHTARTEPDVLQRPFADLYAELAEHVASAETHARGDAYDRLADHPQDLAAWRDDLAWGDLLTIRLITRMMSDQRVIQQWFAQADADRADPSSEYGGLMVSDRGGRINARAYEPTIRRHAGAYYAPAALIVDGYAALAHYHFHAQSYRNRRYAGPSDSDLRQIGDRQQFSGIVLTFIDVDRLNVDYYQAGRIVVDLGTITR